MTVKPLTIHPGVDVWFVQLQLNDTKIRGKARLFTNTGIGYRKLSENKNSFTDDKCIVSPFYPKVKITITD